MAAPRSPRSGPSLRRPCTERWLTTFLGAAGFEEVVIEWQEPPV